MKSEKLKIFEYEKSRMKKKNQMVTMHAEVAVTKMENGLRYVQILPDNPRVGMMEPFCGNGRGQMLSNGTFDFVQRKRIRRKPEFKGPHISLSFGEDGMDRVVFVTPSAQREELTTLLPEEIAMVIAYLKEHLYHTKKSV